MALGHVLAQYPFFICPVGEYDRYPNILFFIILSVKIIFLILSYTSSSFNLIYLLEFNENLGHATHYMCEPSYNFVLQEFSIPGISHLRQMVRVSLDKSYGFNLDTMI